MEFSAEQLCESRQTALNTESMRILSEHAKQEMQLIGVAHLEKECTHAQQYDLQRV